MFGKQQQRSQGFCFFFLQSGKATEVKQTCTAAGSVTGKFLISPVGSQGSPVLIAAP